MALTAHRYFLASLTALLTLAASAQKLPAIGERPTARYSIDSVTIAMKSRPLDPIEGIWQLMPGGSTVVIEAINHPHTTMATTYSMVVGRPVNPMIRPGTLLGIIDTGGQRDTFKARIYTKYAEGRLYMPRTFTLRLNSADSRFELIQHKSRLSINLWKTLPFMWRNSVRISQEEKSYTPGAVRVFPAPAKPFKPVYL